MPPRAPRDTKRKRELDRAAGVARARRTVAPSGGTVWAPAPSAPVSSVAPVVAPVVSRGSSRSSVLPVAAAAPVSGLAG